MSSTMRISKSDRWWRCLKRYVQGPIEIRVPERVTFNETCDSSRGLECLTDRAITATPYAHNSREDQPEKKKYFYRSRLSLRVTAVLCIFTRVGLPCWRGCGWEKKGKKPSTSKEINSDNATVDHPTVVVVSKWAAKRLLATATYSNTAVDISTKRFTEWTRQWQCFGIDITKFSDSVKHASYSIHLVGNKVIDLNEENTENFKTYPCEPEISTYTSFISDISLTLLLS